MNIKLVVTDLDGTLLRDDKTISTRTRSAFARLRENGIKTVYATGRGVSVVDVTSSIQFDGFVRNNGAVAYIQEKQIYKKALPASSTRNILLACDEAGIRVAAECGDMHYTNFTIPDDWDWQVNYKIVTFAEFNEKADKLFAIVDFPKVLDVVTQNLTDTQYLYASRDGYALVMHKDATKSKALASLADYWNIDKSEIVAFGDDTNDIDLLEYCGVGVAMENALNETKAVADQVCGTNESDGVAEWIEENLL